MKRLVLSAMILITGLFFPACIDRYNPEIRITKDLIVIDGVVTDEPGPNFVTIGHSKSYGSKATYEQETQAMVEIIDDKGIAYQLSEVLPGKYATSYPAFQGQIGRKYRLNLITKDGKEYRTDPAVMEPVADIDSLYILPKTNELIKTNYYGQNYSVSDPGFELYSNARGNSVGGSYYHFDGTSTLQYMVRYNVGGGIPVWLTTYCWMNKPLSSDFIITETHSLRDDAFYGFPLSFFSKDTSNTYFLRNRYQRATEIKVILKGWIARVKQYSVSRDNYAFLERLSNQLSRQDRLFDPAIDQVTGNVYNVYDPAQQTLGYFSVSAVKEKAIYFYYSGIDYLEYRILPAFPPVINDGYTDQDPPATWIYPLGN